MIPSSVPLFQVVEVLKEVGICLQVACGHSHSLALVQNEESLKESVYSWGLGSSGQLGLPKSQLQEQLKISPLPQKLKLDPSYRVISLMSGPLAHHSFLIVTRTSNGFANGYPKAHMQSPRMLGSAHVYSIFYTSMFVPGRVDLQDRRSQHKSTNSRLSGC